MKYYYPVYLENLSTIQQKVLQLFPKDKLDKSELFYIPDDLKLFLGIPELKTELDKLGWTQYIDCFGFYVVQKTTGSTIHTDTGNDRVFSFNIPILNCENTFVNYYESTAEPIKKTLPNKVDYYYYDPAYCTLIDSFEMTSPHVINVSKIHNITNDNDRPRITLLVRLNNQLSLERTGQ
jgi:hypothetical protein